ncbi:MAG: TetR/AcrR family transcriptional regulator C-terminal domain-containing protein [Thermomicrobiales bacterium]
MAAKGDRVAAEVSLSKERVVTEAIRLADSEGVDKLSMRRLATELGAGVMSLYYYVANKDELLDAMIDVVFDEIELAADPADWQAAMRQRAVSARRVLARHPWAITLMESRTAPGPANLRHHEAVARLRQAGFRGDGDPRQLAARQLRLRPRAPGSQPPSTAEEFAGIGEEVFVPQLPPDQYPYLNEAAATLIAAGYDPADELAFGLDLTGALDALVAAP